MPPLTGEVALQPFGVTTADLSPHDARSRTFDFTGLNVQLVQHARSPAFPIAYQTLWDYFGEKNELEEDHVLIKRLDWQARPPVPDYAMRYDLILIRSGEQVVAVRDQTAIRTTLPSQRPLTVVHLSHAWIAPPWRGSGLAGWLRAWPMATARGVGAPADGRDCPITLLAEMEPANAADVACTRRLSAYERAGFSKADPTVVGYLQPDFRPATTIDATGGAKPLPLSLILRRCGRENETTIDGGELRATVQALYSMYAATFRQQDMRPNWETLGRYPKVDATVKLVPPTRVNA